MSLLLLLLVWLLLLLLLLLVWLRMWQLLGMESMHALQPLLLLLVWVIVLHATHRIRYVCRAAGGLGVQPGVPHSLKGRAEASLVGMPLLDPVGMRIHGDAQMAIQSLAHICVGGIVGIHVGLRVLCRGVGVHGGLVGVCVIMHGGVLLAVLLWVLKGVSFVVQNLHQPNSFNTHQS